MKNTDRIIGGIVVLIACLALTFAILRVLDSHKQQLAELRARITKLESESLTHQRSLSQSAPGIIWRESTGDALTLNLRSNAR